MTALIDFEGINRAALRDGRSFLQDFIPGGKFRSLEYVVKNPTRDDRNPGSFTINYKTGIWKDFASGEGGSDLISLVAYVGGIGQAEAARELANELGIPLHKSDVVSPSTTNGGKGCRSCHAASGDSYAHCLGRGGSMPELLPDERAITAAEADPGMHKAAARKARGAPQYCAGTHHARQIGAHKTRDLHSHAGGANHG
jgi:hypothetical protein